MSDREPRKRILFLESLAVTLARQAKPENRSVESMPPRAAAGQQSNQQNWSKGVPRKRKLGVVQAKPAGRALNMPNRGEQQPVPNHQAIISYHDQIGVLPPLPMASGRGSHALFISFIVCVVLPAIVASIYYFALASNQYVSQFRFAVTDSSSPTSTSDVSGLSSLLGGITAPNSSQNYLVTDYLTSPEVVDQLQSKINLISIYSKKTIDWWSRFNPSQPIEKFIPYWKSMVTANYDPVTGLAMAQVRAFSPKDAHLIATEMVKLAERLVNNIATRPQKNAVRYAENDVRQAEDRLKTIRAEMTKYRDKERVIDPNSSVVTSNVTLAQSLRASLVQLHTELSSLTQQHIDKNAPTIRVLQSRIDATRKQLTAIEAQIGQATNGNQPLSNVVGQYEQLNLELQFAQNMVTSTMQTLEQARANAAAQHLYITPYVQPTMPESSTYPKRIQSILVLAFYCTAAWFVGVLLFRSIREHI